MTRPDADLAAAAGEIAVVTRSGIVESRHLGHGALVDPDGVVVAAVGTPDTGVFPRSSLKPWQAASIRRAGATVRGAPLDGEVLAITSGSHDATERHVDLVRTMLASAHLGVGALECPSALPGSRAAMAAVLADGDDGHRVMHNCSGKHAGMLLACVANDWPTQGYTAADHPLQQRIRADIEAAMGAEVLATAVDGCGAPQHAVRLVDLARAAGRLARGDEHERAVFDAMRAHPWAVAGPGREDTLAMDNASDIVTKTGAEGVQMIANRDGWAVVVKVLDGAHRAAMTAALALFERSGIDVSAARDATREVVLGGGGPVGEVRPGNDLA